MSFLILSSKNLLRNPGRNLALGLAILYGYSGFVLIAGLITRWESFLRINTVYLNHVAHLSIYKKGGFENHLADPKNFNLKVAEQNKIQMALDKRKDVEFVGRYLRGTGLASNGCKTAPFLAQGLEPKVELNVRSHPMVELWSPELQNYTKGRGFWEYSGTNVLGLSEGLARKLGKPFVFDEINSMQSSQESKIFALDCTATAAEKQIATDSNVQLLASTVSGFMGISEGEIANTFSTGFALTNDSQLKIPLKDLQQLLDTDAVTNFGVFLKPKVSAEQVAHSLEKDFREAGLDVEVFTFRNDKVNPLYTGDLSFLKMLGGFTAVIMSVVIVLSVLNFLAITILERTRELGTLRAMGFSARQIARMFLYENIMLSLFSISLGSLVVYGVKHFLIFANFRFRTPGIAGSNQILVTPTFAQGLLIGAFVLVLVSISTYVFAQRRANDQIQKLLSSTFE